MAVADLKKLRHPSETSRFLFALIVVVPLSLVALVYLVLTLGLILLPILLVLVFIRNIVLASFLGNYVRVSEHNFPQIARWSDEVCASIGYDKPIDVFVYEDGSFNAMLVPILKKKAVLLNSETVHGADETEMKWLLGRFVGYLKGKKMRFWVFEVFLNAFENLFVFNFFLYPYERSAVLTGDRIGAYAAGFNQPRILSAMAKLMVGPDVAGQVTAQGIAEQDGMLRRKPFFSLMARLASPFPHMTRRYTEMLIFFREGASDLPPPEAPSASAASRHPAYASTSPGGDAFAADLPGRASGPGLGMLILALVLGLAAYGSLTRLLDLSEPRLVEPVLSWLTFAELPLLLGSGWPLELQFWGCVAAGGLVAALVGRRSAAVNAYVGVLFIWSLGFAGYTWVDGGMETGALWTYTQYLLLGTVMMLIACIPGYLASRLFGNE
ncbi:M48 family peptidase [Henriciella mobilis]|uniref:M48 family metallopeptidase n=1 Tax=Henriciella mobilis TaxID=2305467 RepID=UPI000E673971|nr:M48 family metallopeptidase [Henriciella mobilis]RIJ15106.1 M48 family peptidase [Henriciella mobilis]RIJ20276.1 M48 family peptidase [Henriciella mobilis]